MGEVCKLYLNVKKKKNEKKFQFSCQQTVFKFLTRCYFYKLFALLPTAIRWQHYLYELDKYI